MHLMKRTLIAVPLSLVLITTACAGNANKGGSDASSTKNTLVAAYSEGGQTLDPAEANDVTSDTFVEESYDQLVTYGRTTSDGKPKANTNKIKPMLAKSWKTSHNKKKYTFTLRRDVHFHDGSKLTAKDVVKTFHRIKQSSSASDLYKLASIKRVSAKDVHTVEISLEHPNHLFMQILPMYSFSILNMSKVSKHKPKWLKSHTAGSGPYKLDKWQPASEAKLQRNEKYWGSKPDIKNVKVKIVGEASNRSDLIRGGDADIATEIDPKDVKSLRQAKGVNIDSRKSNKTLHFGMNTKVKPFDNRKVRQALSYAVPQKRLRRNVMKGQASPMNSAVPSNMPGYCGDDYKYKYNLSKAKKLLADAGYPNGFSFKFTLGAGFPDWNDDAVIIQDALKKIGVTMKIHKMSRSPFLDALDKGKLDTWITRWTSFVNDPSYHLGLLLKSGASSNHPKYSSKQVDSVLEKTSTMTDRSKRDKLYCEAQKTINADAPWAYLYEYNIVLAERTDVKGYTSYPDGIVRFHQMKFK